VAGTFPIRIRNSSAAGWCRSSRRPLINPEGSYPVYPMPAFRSIRLPPSLPPVSAESCAHIIRAPQTPAPRLIPVATDAPLPQYPVPQTPGATVSGAADTRAPRYPVPQIPRSAISGRRRVPPPTPPGAAESSSAVSGATDSPLRHIQRHRIRLRNIQGPQTSASVFPVGQERTPSIRRFQAGSRALDCPVPDESSGIGCERFTFCILVPADTKTRSVSEASLTLRVGVKITPQRDHAPADRMIACANAKTNRIFPRLCLISCYF